MDKGASSSQAPHSNGASENQHTPQGETFKCFRCGEPGHRSSDCRKNMGNNRNKALLIEEVEEHGDFEDAPIFDPSGNMAIGGDSDEEEGLALMLKKTLLSPKLESQEDWLRTNIFYSTCNIGSHVCNMIIDSGSCENVVSQEVVDKLNLPVEEHPHPYSLSWFKKGNEIKVNKWCLVSFSIQQKYFDEAWCDIVPMDACHILLGRPWQYNRQSLHDCKRNTYTVVKNDIWFTLLPMKKKLLPRMFPNHLLVPLRCLLPRSLWKRVGILGLYWCWFRLYTEVLLHKRLRWLLFWKSILMSFPKNFLLICLLCVTFNIVLIWYPGLCFQINQPIACLQRRKRSCNGK